VPNLCVFAGSAAGSKPIYAAEAERLGQTCAHKGWGVVYGGGGSGLMAAVADGALRAGGYVEGVIPDSMVQREWAHASLSDLHIVETMHQRKQRMHDRSDAFVALPGGVGTFDEVCEALAWQKLEIHKKPVALLNVDGFYDHFVALLEHLVREGFYAQADLSRLWVVDECEQLFERLLHVQK
jgi:uncharacterized protein (TIGR00730 family)